MEYKAASEDVSGRWGSILVGGCASLVSTEPAEPSLRNSVAVASVQKVSNMRFRAKTKRIPA